MASKPTSIAKITRPGSQGIFPREHLFTELDQARQKPVLWISGPAGSGKTSLVASYIESRDIPAIWMQLDEGDGDPAAFFYYLGIAFQNVNHHQAGTLPLFTAEYQQSLHLFARRFFEHLCSLLNRPYILVFDNYQEVPARAALHDMLVHGLAAVPEGVSMMFLSRSEPPSSFVRLVANQAVHLMTWNELRLSLDESRSIMRMKGVHRTAACGIEQMHGKCEGWAAGIVLMMVLMRVHSLEEWRSIEKASCREIFDYFAGEVLDRLDESMRSFLLRTAFLPKIHADAANRLAEIDDAEKRLSTLARNQYFTTRSAGGEPVFQYHQLFREFLVATARESWPDETLRQIQRKAAALLEKDGQIEDAAALFLDSEDWEGIIRLVLENARPLISQGRHKTVLKWIERIPESQREKTPWVGYWLGVCRMSEDLTASRKIMRRAYFRFKEAADLSGALMCWSGIVESYIYEWGDMHPLDEWIAEIDEFLSTRAEFPNAEIESRVVLGMFFALMYRQPDHPEMPLWEEKAKNLAYSDADPELRMAVSSHLMMYFLIYSGEHAKAELLLNALRTKGSSSSTVPIAPLYDIVWRSMEGACLWYFNNFEKCHDVLQGGIKRAEEFGVPVWNAMLLCLMGYMSLGQGKTETGKICLKKMSFVLNTGRILDIANYYFIFAFLELIQNHIPQAFEYLEANMHFSRKAGAPTPHHFFLSGYADSLIEMGKFEQAEEQIKQISSFSEATRNQCLNSVCLWLYAHLYFCMENERSGLKYLRRYLEHSRHYRIHNHHWWRASIMARLFVKALNAGIEVAHVQRLIREHNIPYDPAYGDVENWPYPIKIRTLGGFRINVDDKPLSIKRKGQKKPLELLKALIALGGREVPDERIADALWPDADGESGHKAFTTTLYRLRKMIGHDEAILLQGRRLSLNPAVCHVDVDVLEHAIQRAKRLMQPDAEDAAALKRTADTILSAYTGHFLEGEDAPWVISPREVIRTKVLHVLRQIGDFHESRKTWETAADVYEKTLQLDPLAESACQGLMRCWGRLGRKAEALAAYRRCRMMLNCELNIAPSAETERLRQVLESN